MTGPQTPPPPPGPRDITMHDALLPKTSRPVSTDPHRCDSGDPAGTRPAPEARSAHFPDALTAPAPGATPPFRGGGAGSPTTSTPVVGEPQTAAGSNPVSRPADARGEDAEDTASDSAAAAGSARSWVAGGPGHPTPPARRDSELAARRSAVATTGGPDHHTKKRAAVHPATR